jgi:toxin ParE1/3/4
MIRREIVFSPEAAEDLLQLYEWIEARAGPGIAIAYIDRIEEFCAGFDVASERGHLREDIRPGLRIIGFERRLTIAFTVTEAEIVFLRLFYGGQDWEEKL